MDFFTYVDRRQEEDLLAAALDFAAAGWPVFPCRPGAKEPATHHGKDDATTRESLIRSWWSMKPRANVAIATGAPGPDVLDVDVKGDGNGFEAFNRAKRAGLLAGSSAIVHTPSGGLHAYYAGTDQRCGSLPRHLLDFKAAGGYVLAPPSRVTVATEHGAEEDRPYTWVERRDVREAHALDWPAIKRLLDPPAPPLRQAQTGVTRDVPGWLADRLATIDVPDRSAHFHGTVAACRRIGLSPDQTIDLLTPWCEATGKYAARVATEVARCWNKIEGGL